MNTRMNHLNPLCAALRGAHLARAGAMLALALGAAQAGATTYTVPLQFNITLAAPVCSLSVDRPAVGTPSIALAGTVTGPLVEVDLTPNPLASTITPNGIVTALSGSTITAASAGVSLGGSVPTIRKLLSTVPAASATCTLGTPMTARVSKGSGALSGMAPVTALVAGKKGSSQAATHLPVGMAMGIAKFGATDGANDAVTWDAFSPSVSISATGVSQALNLTAAAYAADSTTNLGTNYVGLWTYHFNVSLEF